VDFAELVKTQGPTLAILIVAVVTLWRTWRADAAEASEQRERYIASLGELSDQIKQNGEQIRRLADGLHKPI
jgi:hypothetical protein